MHACDDETLILDVGCGWAFKGDVNVDLFLHRRGDLRSDEGLVYRKWRHGAQKVEDIPNFVCADCHYLPFRDSTFDTVFCSHMIEHKGVNHIQSIKELLRVAKQRIIILVPSPFCASRTARLHDKIFTRDAFNKLFRNFDTKIEFQRYRWQSTLMPRTPKNLLHRLVTHEKFLDHRIPNPLHKLPCPIPTELKVVVNMR